MDLETESHDWPTVDHWWDTYVKTGSSVLTTSTTAALDPRWMVDVHGEIDAWWESYVGLAGVFDNYSAGIGDRSMEDDWMDIEPWWDAYIEARADDVAELEQILGKSNALWERRGGPFDADPLSADLGQALQSGDPLNPGVEEDWSDWLAQLLRTDSGEFHRELFGDAFTAPPRQVEREAHHPKPGGTDRYADLLSMHDSGGISIEVKIGDTNLKKTIDTTDLIEDQNYGEWRHYLLLPEDDLWAVHESFGDEIVTDDGERGVITSEESEDIELLYWSDVSRALRTVLLTENGQSPHWIASAYLFCTQIEQKRLGFTPEPVVEQLGGGANRARSFESVAIVIDDLETQVEYLTAFTENANE